MPSPLFREALANLLTFLAEGRSLDECWRECGFSSREEAAGELMRLVGQLSTLSGAVRKERAKRTKKVVVYVDGASRGNPGPASVAAVAFSRGGRVLGRRARKIGSVTNNVAEYRAVIEGLMLARELGAKSVTIKMDSELVHRQLGGSYRVKNEELRKLSAEVARESRRFVKCEFQHVPREDNREADRLANLVLDES